MALKDFADFMDRE